MLVPLVMVRLPLSLKRKENVYENLARIVLNQRIRYGNFTLSISFIYYAIVMAVTISRKLKRVGWRLERPVAV